MPSLAVKYRPKTFEDLVEQSIVRDILVKICNTDPIVVRNFLLIGPAGCGKTTLSRIIANKLNGNSSNIIEIDAASNNGVDSVRSIVDQARTFPVGSKYKVFICDECFSGDTLISTPGGDICIRDIKPGDTVFGINGPVKVTRLFKNKVKKSNLLSLRVGNTTLLTTKNHLFFTDNGWVEAKDLKAGDNLYDYKTMQSLWKFVPSDVSERSEANLQQRMPEAVYETDTVWPNYSVISKNMSNMWRNILDSEECRCKDLFNEMWVSLQEIESEFGQEIGATFKTLAYIYLSSLWRSYDNPKQRQSENLLAKMCFEDSIDSSSKASCNKTMRMVWKFIYSQLFEQDEKDMQRVLQKISCYFQANRTTRSKVFYANEDEQSNEKSGLHKENDEDKGNEWDLARRACNSWWERALHYTSNSFEDEAGRQLEVRVSSSDRNINKEQSNEVCYELQTRPSLSRIQIRDRGGWCRAQCEISYVARREENSMLEKSRVESIEIYQPGNNDELFRSCFENKEGDSSYATMYDLEISGHPSYFADGILVHNCHAFTSNSWQIFLKTLEESPAKTIFCFCTTNPEKIPATILSRVQTFQLSKISLEGITSRLKYVLDTEISEGRNITYDMKAVSYIAKLARGGMRDALTLLDKALSYSEDVSLENISKSLNLPNYDDYFNLLNACAKKDNSAIAKIVNDVYNSGVNFVTWFTGFHSFVMNIVKYIFLQDINETMIPAYYEDKISSYSSKHSIICLKLANKLLKMNNELKTTSYLQELALTYLCS